MPRFNIFDILCWGSAFYGTYIGIKYCAGI